MGEYSGIKVYNPPLDQTGTDEVSNCDTNKAICLLGWGLAGGKTVFAGGRCRDLVQHPNQARPTAAEATDEDDEEARAFYHPPHPPVYVE